MPSQELEDEHRLEEELLDEPGVSSPRQIKSDDTEDDGGKAGLIAACTIIGLCVMFLIVIVHIGV